MARTLDRTLGTRDLVLLVLGTVIGSGIFIIPAETLRLTGGRVGIALLVWFLGGVLSLLGALTYAEMGAMRPEAGGIYVYIRDAFGRLPAFLYGWVLFLVIGPATVAALAVASTGYLSQLLPLSAAEARILAIAIIAAVVVINVLGTRRSANVQNVTTLLKAGAIVVLSAVLIALGRGGSGAVGPELPSAPTPSLLVGVGAAMIGILWAYEGWQWVTFSAGETSDPQRVFPRGIVIGTAVLVGIYLLANIAYVAALGSAAAARSQSVAADAVTATLGRVAGKVIAATIVVSMFSAAHSVMLTMPRVFFAMARDGLFFRRLADVHPRFRTPAFAIVTSAVLCIALAATGTFTQLLTYVVFAGWIFYALGALSVFVYRSRFPDAVRPFRVPGYPVTPVLFVLSAAAIVVNTIVTQPERAAVGLAVVAAGAPAFYLWRARRRTPTLSDPRSAEAE